MNFETVLRDLAQVNLKKAGKILISVEGATCSGKTTFVLNMYSVLKSMRVPIKVIPEAASEIFKKQPLLLKKLNGNPSSPSWVTAKVKLQKHILQYQSQAVLEFAADNRYKVAIMDRAGASTAYHTLPYVKEDKFIIEQICKEITKLSKIVILLCPLGFLEKGMFRYQKSIEEIEKEAMGIKRYLDQWGISYLELKFKNKKSRENEGLKFILNNLNIPF